MKVEHAGNAVKTKTVKAVFIEPEPAVGKKKMKHLEFSVVKASGIPGLMNSPGSFMKILMSRSVESAQPLHLVGDTV
jgi:hypothetical protein